MATYNQMFDTSVGKAKKKVNQFSQNVPSSLSTNAVNTLNQLSTNNKITGVPRYMSTSNVNTQNIAGVPKTYASTPIPTQPIQTQNQAYTSDFTNQIVQGLSNLTKMLNEKKQYSPYNDAGLQAAQQQAGNEVARQMAARGVLYSSMTPEQTYQSSLNLIPQFQQMSEQKRQQEIANLTNQLGMLQGLESNDYARYRDTVGDTRYNQEFTFNKALQEAGLTGQYGKVQTLAGQELSLNKLNQQQQYDLQQQQLDLQKQAQTEDIAAQRAGITGTYLSPEQQKSLSGGVNSPRAQELSNLYSKDYQKEISRLESTDPLNPDLVVLKQLRNKKILDNKLNYALSQIGTETLEGKQIKSQLESQKLAQEEQKLNNQQAMMTLKNMPKELENTLTLQGLEIAGKRIANEMAKIDLGNYSREKQVAINSAIAQLNGAQLNNAAQSIINSSLSEKEKAQIAQVWANVDQTDIQSTLALNQAIGTQGGKYDYKQDQGWLADYSAAISGGDTAKKALTQDQASINQYIQAYGVDGYKSLLQASGVTKKSQDDILAGLLGN